MRSRVLASVCLAMLVWVVAADARAEEQGSNVLAPGYKLPKGFTSIRVTEQPSTKWQQIDALYKDPADGSIIRFTTVRGSKDMAEPGRHPIDVCIRDGKTSEVLLPPQVFGSKPIIENCTLADTGSEARKKRAEQIMKALDALTAVRFKPEYRPEYIALVNQAMGIVIDETEGTEFGGGVIIHRKNPALPLPAPGEAAPAKAAPSNATPPETAPPAK